jgi:hypothetical protein
MQAELRKWTSTSILHFQLLSVMHLAWLKIFMVNIFQDMLDVLGDQQLEVEENIEKSYTGIFIF